MQSYQKQGKKRVRYCSNAVPSLFTSSSTRNGYGFKPRYFYNSTSHFLLSDRWKLWFKQYKQTNCDEFEQIVHKHVSNHDANGVKNTCQDVNKYDGGQINN